MRIQIKNLGALKQAEFTLGELTIICGSNNTGKTYATYALFGFLYFWREIFSVHVDRASIETLLSDGTTIIDLSSYIKDAENILSTGCKNYAKKLAIVFATNENRFTETEFKVDLDSKDIQTTSKFDRVMRAANDTELFSIIKNEASTELIITLLAEKEKVKIPIEIISSIIGNTIKDIMFGHLFPSPFIASAERTGAAIFRKELNFARNRLLEEMHTKKDLDPMDLLFNAYQDYALPVKTNVDFTRRLETTSKQSSFISKEHPELLREFSDIIGGEYTVTRNDELYFVPKNKKIKLSMDESSSAVRSLLDVGFYLKHVAQFGDLLIVDEPELNLHPENQCRIAKLFARLVNLGIRVFITTHSDYIIKEFNTLIMLNSKKLHIEKIAKKEGYKKEEFLSSEKIKVYIAEEALVRQDGKTRKSSCQTLTPAKIDSEMGIEARSFDITIEKMNRIQEEIVWGGE